MLLTLCPWQITTSSSLLSDNKTHNGPLLSCSELRQSRDCFNQDRVPDNTMMASLPATGPATPQHHTFHLHKDECKLKKTNWLLNNPVNYFIDPMCSSLIGSWSWKCGIMTLKCENYKCLAFNESKMKHLSFILIVLTQITHVWSQTFYVCFYGDILYALQQNNWQQMYTRGAKKCERTVPAASDVTHLDECSEPSAPLSSSAVALSEQET